VHLSHPIRSNDSKHNGSETKIPEGTHTHLKTDHTAYLLYINELL